MGKASPEVASELYDKGFDFMSSAGRFVDATDCLRKALEEAPDSHFHSFCDWPESWVLNETMTMDYREEAIDLCRQVVDECKTDDVVFAGLVFSWPAFSMTALSATRKQLEPTKQGLALDDKFIVGHNNLGAVSLRACPFLDEAEGHFFKALQLRPEYTKVYQNLAKNVLSLGRPRAIAGRSGKTPRKKHPKEAPEILNRPHGLLSSILPDKTLMKTFTAEVHRLKKSLCHFGHENESASSVRVWLVI